MDGMKFEQALNRLARERDTCQDATLRHLHQAAIDKTHAAGQAFLDLAAASEEEGTRYIEWMTATTERIQADSDAVASESEALVQRLEAAPELADTAEFNIDKDFLLVRIYTLQVQGGRVRIDEQLRARETTELRELLDTLFDKVLDPEPSESTIAGMKSAFGFGAGIATGALADMAARVWAFHRRHSLRAAQTDLHLRYLTTYQAALDQWIAQAQTTTRRLRSTIYQ